MRAIGIILVICFHVVVGLTTLLDAGALDRYIDSMPYTFNIAWQALGSELVFLFSGFLLSYILLREYMRHGRIDIGEFYVRRLSRILPLYLLALMFYALIRDFTLLDLTLNVLFVSKLFGATTIIPIGWSLELLVQSYLLLPFGVLILMRSGHPLKFTVTLIFACLGARYIALFFDPQSYRMHMYEFIFGADAPATQNDLYYLLGYRATPFLLGFFLAYLVIYKEQLLRHMLEQRWILWGTGFVSLFFIILSGFLPLQDQHSFIYQVTNDKFWLWFWTLQRFVFALGFCGLTLCLWFGQTRLLLPVNWLIRRDVLAKISRDIYSVYLFHPIFLIPAAVIGFRTYLVEEIEPIYTLEVIVIIVLVTFLSTVFGEFLTRFAEEPARRWIRNRLGGFHWFSTW